MFREEEPGQIQRGRPALYLLMESVRLFRREGQTELLEQPGALGSAHREVTLSQLEDLALGAHPAQRQLRLLAGGQRNLTVRAKTGDHVGEGIRCALAPDRVRVVHDEHEGPPLEADAVDGFDQAVQKPRRIVISRSQAHPGKGPVVLLGPLGQHAGLRVAGGRSNKNERVIPGVAKTRDELRAAHIPVVQGWDRHGGAEPERILCRMHSPGRGLSVGLSHFP